MTMRRRTPRRPSPATPTIRPRSPGSRIVGVLSGSAASPQLGTPWARVGTRNARMASGARPTSKTNSGRAQLATAPAPAMRPGSTSYRTVADGLNPGQERPEPGRIARAIAHRSIADWL
jgi:hypothetical protein